MPASAPNSAIATLSRYVLCQWRSAARPANSSSIASSGNTMRRKAAAPCLSASVLCSGARHCSSRPSHQATSRQSATAPACHRIAGSRRSDQRPASNFPIWLSVMEFGKFTERCGVHCSAVATCIGSARGARARGLSSPTTRASSTRAVARSKPSSSASGAMTRPRSGSCRPAIPGECELTAGQTKVDGNRERQIQHRRAAGKDAAQAARHQRHRIRVLGRDVRGPARTVPMSTRSAVFPLPMTGSWSTPISAPSATTR